MITIIHLAILAILVDAMNNLIFLTVIFFSYDSYFHNKIGFDDHKFLIIFETKGAKTLPKKKRNNSTP